VQTQSSNSSISFESILNSKTIAKGLRWFIIFSIAGLAALSLHSSTPQTFAAFGRFEVRFLFIALALATIDFWLGALRFHLFVRELRPGLSPWLSLRANLANEFMAAMTPTQSGGGPAWIYVLHRGGVPISASLSISVITFASTMLYFALAAGISWAVIREHVSHELVATLIKYSFFALSTVILLLVLAVWQPRRIVKALAALAKRLAAKRSKWSGRIHHLSERMREGLEQFQATFRHFLYRRPRLLVYCFGMTVLLYTTKFTLAYFILAGLGVIADLLVVLAILTIIRLVLYFAPTPGGSGIAELSIAALMSALLESYLLPIFTVLYRFFQIYLPGALGAFVLMNELRARQSTAPLKAQEQNVKSCLKKSLATMAMICLVAVSGNVFAQEPVARPLLLQRTFDAMHHERYDSALALCAALRALAPEEAAGDVMAATVYQAMMRVYRMRIFEAELDSLSRRAEQLAQKHARKANTAEAWFMLGTAKGNLALQRFNRGEWAGGLQDAILALNAMKQARQRDRDFHDPDLALGLYEYWKNKRLGMGMGLFSRGRKEALRTLEAVHAKARFVGRDAELTLQDLYMHEGEYERALAINENLLPELPLNASVLYHRAVLLEKLGRGEEALPVWEKLYERVKNFIRPSYAFMAECQLHRARILTALNAEPAIVAAAAEAAAESMHYCDRAVEMAGPFESFEDIDKAIAALRKSAAELAARKAGR
jgi:uncharacterized protein (TIRG00374 family)